MKTNDKPVTTRAVVYEDTHHMFREAAGVLHVQVVDAYLLGAQLLLAAGRNVNKVSKGNIDLIAAQLTAMIEGGMSSKPPIVVPARVPPLLAHYAKDAPAWWGFVVAALPLLPPSCLGGVRVRVNVTFSESDFAAFEALRQELDLSQSRLVEAGCALLYARDKTGVSRAVYYPDLIAAAE